MIAPKLPPALAPATVADHDLEDEATFTRLAFEIDLPGRTAESVEFDQCRFRGADLSGCRLRRARFSDCLIETTNLANLRAERAAMWRTHLTGSRLTGLHWLDGSLHHVTVEGCRADLAVFRSTSFRQVRFQQCNLTRADFQNADLTGAEFVDCDLSGAQFSYATMTGARFQACQLDGIGGVTSFHGAILTDQDLVALSHTLAAGLGIAITEP